MAKKLRKRLLRLSARRQDYDKMMERPDLKGHGGLRRPGSMKK